MRTDVLDPLDDAEPLDPAPLARALADPAVQVIMHAGRQDVAILRRTWDTDITQRVRHPGGGGLPRVRQPGGLRVAGAQRARRASSGAARASHAGTSGPLTEKQISYAADDARLLLALGAEIERRLTEKGRLEWAREECLLVQASRDERSPERAYERLPKLGRLDAGQRAAARRLCEWREGLAREADRPPSYIVPDQALIELARRRPRDKRRARGHPRAPPADAAPARSRSARADRAQAVTRSRRPRRRRRRRRDSVRGAAGVAGPGGGPPPLDGERGGHRADRHPVGAGGPGAARCAAATDGSAVRALEGWRRELVGDELRELIEGRRAVSVAPDGGLVVAPA